MTQFCTACGRAVSAKREGKQIQYPCSCGANHISLKGVGGVVYLARVFPVQPRYAANPNVHWDALRNSLTKGNA